MSLDKVKPVGVEASKRLPGHNPGGVLHQRRIVPHSSTTRVILLITGIIWYAALCTQKKPDTDAIDVPELESLTIEVCKGYSDLPGGFGGYKIPSCLFSCAGLKHLKLSSCVIEASCQVTGFSHLTRLELYRVDVSRGTLETIIGESPLLEKLSLRDCFIKEDSLLIYGPELRLLDVQCHYPKALQLQRPLNVVSVTVKQLLVVQVDDSNTSNLVDFLCHLPVAEDVSLDLICDNEKPFSETFTSYNIPRKLPVALESMKKLTIEGLSPNEADHISYLLCLIRSSPALTTLELRLCMLVNDVNEEITVETQGRDEASSNSLQTIKITQVRGTKHEMMLIKCLISYKWRE
uniref:F-box/LRR-repeat protein 15/At3g58940/PEG3-like LRR domain-containing protein n=1 Tax=Kalanchoe fedtschenkoi TaxID=63787 RepID=A0A7N0TLQ8_KALFE